MFYTVTIYCLVLTSVVLYYPIRFKMMKHSSAFDSVVYILIIIQHIMEFSLPITRWWETRFLANYMKKWIHFEEMVYPRCWLRIDKRYQSVLLTLTVVLFSCFREILFQVIAGHELKTYEMITVIVLCYQASVQDVSALFWYLVCKVVQQTAIKMLVDFQKIMGVSSQRAIHIAQYRVMWLELSQLIRVAGDNFCYSYGLLIFHLALTLTLTVYGLLSILMQGMHVIFIILFVKGVVAAYTINTLFNTADSVQENVRQHFEEGLLELRATYDEESMKTEVDAFIKTIEVYPPIISLGDYATLNRQLLLSLCSTLLTYLMVLLQYKVSTLSTK